MDGKDDLNRVNKGKSKLVLDMSGKKLALKRNNRNGDRARSDKTGDDGERL